MQSNKPEKSALDYEALGVTPPEITPHDEQARDAAFESQRRQGHLWKQNGNHIECSVHGFTHGHVIPVDKKLTGTDDRGMPILADIVLSDS